MARRGYTPEFRRRVVDLVEGGRKVPEGRTSPVSGRSLSVPVHLRLPRAVGAGTGGDAHVPAERIDTLCIWLIPRDLR